MQSILTTLATVSEDLAVELLSTSTADDLEELANVITHLSQAADVLTENQVDAPFAVLEIIRHFREQQGKTALQ